MRRNKKVWRRLLLEKEEVFKEQNNGQRDYNRTTWISGLWGVWRFYKNREYK